MIVIALRAAERAACWKFEGLSPISSVHWACVTSVSPSQNPREMCTSRPFGFSSDAPI